MVMLCRPICSLALASALVLTPLQAYAFSRIKDLADVEGIRENMLIGYGLVVGLNNSGDSLKTPMAQGNTNSSVTPSA